MNFLLPKMTLPLVLALAVTLLTPALSQAEDTYGTGGIAARQAAEQKAAIAKKKERRKQEAEAKKHAEEQKGTATQTEPAATPKEEAPAQ